MIFFNSLQSEWIKKRRSAASWLTLVGGLFVPAILTCVRLIQHTKTLQINSSDEVWNTLFNQCWQFMAILLLPMGIILAASLITQIEFRNNTWKQLHTTPQSLSTIFWAKLCVVVIMLIQFFVLLNVGIFISGILPALVYQDVPFPRQDFPWLYFLQDNSKFFIECLPILAIQYMLSLHIRNFMIPIGIGIALLLASMIALSWKYGYVLPYTYCSLQYMANDSRIDSSVNIYAWAISYFTVFTLINYVLYLNNGQKTGAGILKRRTVKLALAVAIIGLSVAGVYLIAKFSKPSAHISIDHQNKIKQVEENVGFAHFKVKGKNSTHMLERMKNYGINGLSIAVIDNYEIVWAKGYGWADVEEKRSVTTETLFQPGSISKSINALGIAKLYQEKKVDLFTDINAYLTSWKFPYDSVVKGKKITLAQLLSHSAGLNIHGFGFTAYSEGDSLPTVIQILDGVKPSITPAVRSIMEPGWKYKYSGGGTMISQQLIMDLTHQNYSDFMRDYVLLPLGMTSSFFTQPPSPEKVNRLATGYNFSQLGAGKPILGKYPITPQQAAAGLWTTPTDLARMIIQVQKSLAGTENTFLLKNIINLMLTPYNDKLSALGFFIDDKNGTLYFQHGAGNPGFSGWYYGSMKGGKGVAICINSADHAEIFDEIIKSVAGAYEWEGFEKSKVPVERTVTTLPDSIKQKFTGVYQLGNSVVVVQRKEDDLWFGPLERSLQMHFTSDTSFINIESTSEKFFTLDKKGNVSGFTFQNDQGIKRKANKIQELIISKHLVEKYAGKYVEPGKEIASITIRENQLWLISENAIAPMRLHFLTNDSFYLEENGGIFTFEMNNGRVTGVTAKGDDAKKMILTRRE